MHSLLWVYYEKYCIGEICVENWEAIKKGFADDNV
jgi:hypothetical protein